MAESVSYNRPSLNWISSGLALVGIGSVALGVYMLAKSDWGTSTHPVYSTWFFGGLVTIAVGIVGFRVVLLGITFTVPQLAVDTYRLAESIDAEGPGCHIFAWIHVVAELPDTAQPPIGPAPQVGPALAAGASLLAIAVVLARLRARL